MVEERFRILSFALNFNSELSIAGIESPLLLLFNLLVLQEFNVNFYYNEFLLGPGNIVLSVE